MSEPRQVSMSNQRPPVVELRPRRGREWFRVGFDRAHSEHRRCFCRARSATLLFWLAIWWEQFTNPPTLVQQLWARGMSSVGEDRTADATLGALRSAEVNQSGRRRH